MDKYDLEYIESFIQKCYQRSAKLPKETSSIVSFCCCIAFAYPTLSSKIDQKLFIEYSAMQFSNSSYDIESILLKTIQSNWKTNCPKELSKIISQYKLTK